MSETEKLLEVRNLRKHFEIKPESLSEKPAILKAVDDVSFDVLRGETVGIVGESGCGKSTLGRTIVALHEKTSGSVLYRGRDIFALDRGERKALRRNMQMIFQDPFSSLNPRKKVRSIIGQPLRIHGVGDRGEIESRVAELMAEVGLLAEQRNRYPHQFSGGQRQRICIARALAMEPELLIADEAVSALDVSVQAQVLRLFDDIRERLNLTMLFITHDLRVAAQICDTVAVMQHGKVVECGAASEILVEPKHAYTRSLIEPAPGRHWTFGQFGATHA
jgi:ABC-type oligopeptide transport system ATPase subunit